MNRVAAVCLIALALAGCGPTQKVRYLRMDGQVVPGNPALVQKAETDHAICIGEAQKANLSAGSGPGNNIGRDDAVLAVYEGCMASRGYRKTVTPAA